MKAPSFDFHRDMSIQQLLHDTLDMNALVFNVASGMLPVKVAFGSTWTSQLPSPSCLDDVTSSPNLAFKPDTNQNVLTTHNSAETFVEMKVVLFKAGHSTN